MSLKMRALAAGILCMIFPVLLVAIHPTITHFTIGSVAIVTYCLLGIYFYKVIHNLSGNLSKIKGSAGEIQDLAKMLAGGSEKLSSSTTETAASLEETASSIEELSNMANHNAEHANASVELAKQAKTFAQDGEKLLAELLNHVQAMAEDSRRIEEIIGIIDNIAFQTNLLALNAAVEAARAGEHGKGFSVVAEAVRNLAQKSANSAKEIALLIQQSVDKSRKGLNIAKQTYQNFQNITESNEKVVTLLQEIALASREQATAIEQMEKALMQLDRSNQQNAASAEELAAQARQFLQTAGNILESLRTLMRDLVVDPSQASLEGMTESVELKPRASKVENAFKPLPTKQPELHVERTESAQKLSKTEQLAAHPAKDLDPATVIPFDDDAPSSASSPKLINPKDF